MHLVYIKGILLTKSKKIYNIYLLDRTNIYIYTTNYHCTSKSAVCSKIQKLNMFIHVTVSHCNSAGCACELQFIFFIQKSRFSTICSKNMFDIFSLSVKSIHFNHFTCKVLVRTQWFIVKRITMLATAM